MKLVFGKNSNGKQPQLIIAGALVMYSGNVVVAALEKPNVMALATVHHHRSEAEGYYRATVRKHSHRAEV